MRQSFQNTATEATGVADSVSCWHMHPVQSLSLQLAMPKQSAIPASQDLRCLRLLGLLLLEKVVQALPLMPTLHSMCLLGWAYCMTLVSEAMLATERISSGPVYRYDEVASDMLLHCQ